MRYSVECAQPIMLGMQGDTSAKEIMFDISELMAIYPYLTNWYIEAMTPCQKYYTPDVKMQDRVLCWKVTQKDTLCSGYGKYQIVAEGENGEKKTFDWRTFIVRSKIASPDDVSCDCCEDPMTVEEATEAMIEMLEKAEIAAARAEEAVEQMEKCDICNGSGELIFDGGDSETNIHNEEVV